MKEKGKLYNNLHVLRAQNKWSQKDVAEKVGVSRQTIVSIEANKYNPSLILAFKLANLFDVDINNVFEYKEEIKDGNIDQ
ncbi:helix-turn-helix transcriptional regulator [Bacillus carboniphilus]|uniref:Helix-turn-helix transcriptional regulator n=1 Tax=Bacillus carboniphilus TaxID=86663 RepID=A0ABY9JT51_9BACI|nr:helix-turn-helix transcriptional regulator [Bacillus carboniphilus]WLR41683.1 helix-turn-helix transcriptional regulator [Bacillus carboniphilus]